MAFIKLILKNIWRRRTRTILTILGISLGIGTIVTLGVISEGVKDSMESTVKTGEADFTVAQANVADFSFSIVTQEQVRKIRKLKNIDSAIGVLFSFLRTKENPLFIAFGMNSSDAKLIGTDMVKGRLFKDGSEEIAIGKIAAKNMDLGIGDTLTSGRSEFKIVGIFQTGNPMQDGGGLISLKTAQKIEQKSDKVTMVLVKVDDSVEDIEAFAENIERKFDNELVTIVSVADFSSVDQGLKIMDFMSGAISFLAIVIGGIGVMNTIMMSVFERTREIGILRAIGWKRRRVLLMILGESFFLGLISIIIGTAIGLAVIQYIMTFPVAESFFSPDYSPATFQRALAVGILVSILGGLYPALRATRFSPAEALRYE